MINISIKCHLQTQEELLTKNNNISMHKTQNVM